MQAQFQSPIITHIVQKMKDLPKTWILRGKQIEEFRRQKEQKHYSRPFKKTQRESRTLKPSTENGPCKQ